MNNTSSKSSTLAATGTLLAQSLLEERGWSVVQPAKSGQRPKDQPPPPSYASLDHSIKMGDGILEQKANILITSGEEPTSVAVTRRSGTNDVPSDGTMTDPTDGNSVLSQRLRRGLSNTMNNAQIINIARDLVLSSIKEGATASAADSTSERLSESLKYTFILPDINRYEDGFKTFLHKDLIETSTLVSLEQAGRLNWWFDTGLCARLLPLATTGDGNCLLHAASLGIWGFHDRRLTLRKALCQTLTEDVASAAFKRRWKWNQTQINKQSGLIYTDQEWDIEWNNLLKLASAQPRNTNNTSSNNNTSNGSKDSGNDSDDDSEVFYESLEELHVFVLAHVLCRPIIIVADTILKDSNGDALAPISFGGIYLPLECDSVLCYRTPLLLTYDAAHFSAIVPMEGSGSPTLEGGIAAPQLPAAIPLVDPDFNPLPIHFMVDPGTTSADASADDSLTAPDSAVIADSLLDRYLDVLQIPIPSPKNTTLGGRGTLERGVDPPEGSVVHAGSWSELARTASTEDSSSSLAAANTDSNNGASTPKMKRGGSVKDTKSVIKEELEGEGCVTEGETTEGGGGKKNKNKLSRPPVIQSVAKSFGSLGRSFRKTFSKKNVFGSLGRSSKLADKNMNTSMESSVSSSTSASMTDVVSARYIPCAALLHRRQSYQETMVQNYLTSARDRYEKERDKIPPPSSTTATTVDGPRYNRGTLPEDNETQCINNGCEGAATAATSYLCKKCFERQCQDELDMRNACRPNATSTPSETAPSTHSPDGSSVAVGNIPRVDSGPYLPRQVQSPKSTGSAVRGGGGSGPLVINVAPVTSAGVSTRPMTELDSSARYKSTVTFHTSNGSDGTAIKPTASRYGDPTAADMQLDYSTPRRTDATQFAPQNITESTSRDKYFTSSPTGRSSGTYSSSGVVSSTRVDNICPPNGETVLSSYRGGGYSGAFTESVAQGSTDTRVAGRCQSSAVPETLTLYRDESSQLHSMRLSHQGAGGVPHQGAGVRVSQVGGLRGGGGADWDAKNFEKDLESSLTNLRETISVGQNINNNVGGGVWGGGGGQGGRSSGGGGLDGRRCCNE